MIHNTHTSRLDLLKESAERSAKDIELQKEELMHHGILGMKWGIRRYQPYPKGHNQLKEGGRFTGNKPKKMSKKERLEKRIESSRKEGVRRYQNKDGSLTSAGRKRYQATSSDSAVTKKVKKDLASLSESDFKKKYGASAKTYMKRVDKYGDPYMNAPLAKIGKFLEKQAQNNANRYMKKANKKESVRNQKLQIKRGKAKAKSIIKQFGEPYPVTVDEKGVMSIKIGDDLWKVTY